MDVIEELKFLGKFTKKMGGGVGGVGLGVQGGCEQRIEALVKIKKKNYLGGGRGGGEGVGGRRRVGDVNEELKFLRKFKKQKWM